MMRIVSVSCWRCILAPAGRRRGETNTSRNAEATSTLPVADLPKPVDASNQELTVNTEEPGYIQFEERFSLRSVRMNSSTLGPLFFGIYNRPAHSLEVQASEDGQTFRRVGALESMAHSW
jgi:hypothetical protein